MDFILILKCFLVVLILIFQCTIIGSENKKKFGKYTLHLREHKFCKGKYPQEKPPVLNYTIEVFQRQGFPFTRGNLTIAGDTRKIKASYTCSSIINNKEIKKFEVININCKHIMGSVMLIAAGIPFNKKTCAMKKGTYPYEFDVNGAHNMMIKEWEYGTVSVKMELTNGKKSTTCGYSIIDIVPQ